MMYLRKLLITRWRKVEGVWSEFRELVDARYGAMLLFHYDDICSKDSYIRSVEFIYEKEDK